MNTKINSLFKIIFLVFYCAIFKPSWGQQRQIDSLLSVLKTAKNDTSKLNLYFQILDKCDWKDNLKYAQAGLDITENILQQAKSENQKRNLIKKKGDLYNFCAFYYQQLGDTANQRNILFNELELFKTIDDTNTVFQIYQTITNYYFNLGNTPYAIKYFNKTIDFAKLHSRKDLVSYGYFQMAGMFEDIGDYKNAKDYYTKVKALWIELKDTRLAWVINKIGSCYAGLHDLPNALKCFNESIDLSKKTSDSDENKSKGITRTILEIANAYKFNNEYKNAVISYQKALEMAKKLSGFEDVQFQCLNRIGNTYRDAKNYDSALVYIARGLNLAKELNNERRIMQSEFSLAKIYYAKENYTEAKKILSDEKYKKAQLAYGLGRDMVEIEKYFFKIDSTLGFHKDALCHYIKYKQLYEKFNNEDLTKQATKEKYQEEFDKQQAEQAQKDVIVNKEKQKQKLILWFVLGGLALLAVFAAFIYNRFKVSQKQNKIISEQKLEVDTQKHLVEEKQKEIIESITYAKRLQEAILPPKEFIDKHLTNNFILYKPKDLVAGDFYWAENINDLFFIAAADSTGHGVPGAMVSVVCSNALNRTVKEFNLTSTGEILDKARELVLETFEKSTSEVKDGMDISLLCIDSKNKSIFWSGANNPLWYIQDNQLKEIKADKQPIGKTEYPKPFTTHKIEYIENTTFYLFTDGFADQFGGPNGKKFKYKQFSDLLFKNKDLLQLEQSNIIDKAFTEWKGDLEQVDDVCIIGIKI